MILLMAEIRQTHQLRLVVDPIIYRVLYIQTVVGNGISEPSRVTHPNKGEQKVGSCFFGGRELMNIAYR